jgi:hypothetical protein
MVESKKRLLDKKAQEDNYQSVLVQKYARIDGLVAGSSFINILSDMGKISPDLSQGIELDGPISGYFLRYYLNFYQKARKNSRYKNLPSYVVNFCQAFDTVVMATMVPTRYGRYGLTARDMEHLVNIPLAEKEIHDKYHAYASGRYKNSENLWKTKIDENSSKKRYAVISDATRYAFSIGQQHAYINFTKNVPQDINATVIAEEVLNHYKSNLAESYMDVTLEEWTIAYRRGFIKLWDALIRRDITIPKLREKIGNRPIPIYHF